MNTENEVKDSINQKNCLMNTRERIIRNIDVLQ